MYIACVECEEPFSEENVHTEAGWRETQISGLCEDCFDEICAELEKMYEEGGAE